MYNPGLFFPRQEPKMPAKKAASKKRKKTATRRKAGARKTTSRKRVTKKKAASKKKAPGRKKVTRKKVARKKVTRKKVAKKKAGTRKKATSKKKATSRKRAAKKKPASKKKAASRKKPASKKKAVRRKKPASKKKAPARKKVVKKATRKKPAAHKKAISKKRTVTKKKVPAARKSPIHSTKRRKDVLSGPIHGIAPYKPKRGEDYMSDAQVEHFRDILSAWKRELIVEVDRTVHHMQDEAANFPDPNDRATQESEFGLELRTRDRERKLLRKIDSALIRLDDGSYGFCDETGEEIGLKRLEARPVATLCLEAQERRELAERQFRDRDDRYR
jgi:DnaK suppressor protein